MLIVFLLFFVLVTVFIVYGVLPTVLMRTFSLGLFNRSHVKGKVALTFDDGPHPEYTPKLLDLLKKYEAKATFFIVGEFAENHPEILKRMDREGHLIGIHHYRHVSNWLISPFRTRRECKKTAEVIERIIGKRPSYYRPPWGHLHLFIPWSRGAYRLVIWSDILGDWNRKLGKERLENRLRHAARDGAIIVLHDSDQTPGADKGAPLNMLWAVDRFLTEFYHRYEFVTIDVLYESEQERLKSQVQK
ncbi:polysaccharide deacetylase family protein [Camelliibacillus cellulosilyticus]